MSATEELYQAVSNGDVVRVRELVPQYLKAGYKGDGILSEAWQDNKALIEVLVELGVNPDERDTAAGTLLMTASANGELDLASWLVAHGADIDACNDEGETPFSYACASDQLEMAMWLAEHGANINCVHRRGGTPLDDRKSSDRVLEFLSSIGAKAESELRGE